MTEEQQELYNEGYRAFQSGQEDHQNPHKGMDAEFWSDGWEDAKDDEFQG